MTYFTENGPQHRQLLFAANSVCGSFSSYKVMNIEWLWDGAFNLSSLSEKPRESNNLQMSLQRQHFLLSSLKTMSVGSMLKQLSQPMELVQ